MKYLLCSLSLVSVMCSRNGGPILGRVDGNLLVGVRYEEETKRHGALGSPERISD